MQEITTFDAPFPQGHYAQAVAHGGLVYISGQLPINPQTDDRYPLGSIAEQTQQVLENIAAILRAASSHPGLVIHMTVYLLNLADKEPVNAILAGFFGEHLPSRSLMGVAELQYG